MVINEGDKSCSCMQHSGCYLDFDRCMRFNFKLTAQITGDVCVTKENVHTGWA